MTRSTRLLPLLLISLLASGAGWAEVQDAEREARAFDPGAGTSYPDGERAGAPGGPGHHFGGPGMPGPGFGPGPARWRMALRELDLSESQRGEIRAIFDQDRAQAAARHDQMAALADELEEQIASDPLDEEAVRDKAAALAALRVEMAVLRARQMGRVRDVLTGEQLDRLEEMRSERRARRHERPERFERRRGPRRGS